MGPENKNDNNDERDTSKLSLGNDNENDNETSNDDDTVTTELKAEFDDLLYMKKEGDDETLTEEKEPDKKDKEDKEKEESNKEEKREEPKKEDEQPEVAKELVRDTRDYKKEFEELAKRHEALEKTVAGLKPKETVIDAKDAVAAVSKTTADLKVPEVQEAKISLPAIDADKLAKFLSGDPEQAMPVLTEFVNIAALAVGQYITQKANNEREVNSYAEKANQRFYELNEDLVEYKDVVSQAYAVVMAKHPDKWPHEVFDEISTLAKRTIDYIAQKKGIVQPEVISSDDEIKTVHRTVQNKGGSTTSGVRPNISSANNTLTEQQKEMFELIDPELDHTKVQ